MQESAQTRQSEALSAEEGQLFGVALKELQSLGFIRFKQNLRLLKKTNGNLEAVREYLVAKKKLRDALKAKKDAKKEARKECPCRRRKKDERSSEEKEDKKAEKKELKALFKAGRKEWKKSRKEWKKALKKEGGEDSANREGEEQRAGHPRRDRVSDPNVDAKTLPFLSVWPEQVTRLYLDGNNMLYVTAPVREKAIHHHMASAELALSSVAFQFTKLVLPASVKTTMVFDAASQPVTQSYAADNFQILSARPAFASSDDALVHWVKENAAREDKRVISLVVTSDRELQRRLAEVSGVVLVKPKVWMEFAAAMLEKQKNSNNNTVEAQKPLKLDEWMALWIQKMKEEESLADMLETSLTLSNAN